MEGETQRGRVDKTYRPRENSNPVWNASGNKIAYWRTGVPGYFFILDENGTILDTLEKMKARPAYDWSDNERFALPGSGSDINSYRVGYFDFATEEFTYIDEIGEMNYIYQAAWGEGNDDIYWAARRKVAKTNIRTGQRTELAGAPFEVNSRFYEGITLSPDFKHIVYCRQNQEKVSDCDWAITYRPYIMNMDGSDEREIVIPEE